MGSAAFPTLIKKESLCVKNRSTTDCIGEAKLSELWGAPKMHSIFAGFWNYSSCENKYYCLASIIALI